MSDPTYARPTYPETTVTSGTMEGGRPSTSPVALSRRRVIAGLTVTTVGAGVLGFGWGIEYERDRPSPSDSAPVSAEQEDPQAAQREVIRDAQTLFAGEGETIEAGVLALQTPVIGPTDVNRIAVDASLEVRKYTDGVPRLGETSSAALSPLSISVRNADGEPISSISCTTAKTDSGELRSTATDSAVNCHGEFELPSGDYTLGIAFGNPAAPALPIETRSFDISW